MNIAVAQSGGPTCAINASLVGVFRESLKEPAIDAIFGSVNGVEGIIQDHLIDLKTMIRTNEDMELLRQTPSTVLGSCRYKLPDFHEDSSVYEKIAAVLKRRKIGAFFYIGGNDSMDTVQKLSAYFKEIDLDVKVIGIPKTIDNDLCITDHTPGFGSAANYAGDHSRQFCVQYSLCDDCRDHGTACGLAHCFQCCAPRLRRTGSASGLCAGNPFLR